jgi:hypothetical protein
MPMDKNATFTDLRFNTYLTGTARSNHASMSKPVHYQGMQPHESAQLAHGQPMVSTDPTTAAAMTTTMNDTTRIHGLSGHLRHLPARR